MSTWLDATPAGVRLGPGSLVAEGAARNFVLQIGAERFHGFVVRRHGAVHGYVDRCPHAGMMLAQELDAYLSPLENLIVCSWHGALFEIETGRCVGGPCQGARLRPWPVREAAGWLVTG